MSVSDLYKTTILEHARNPRNWRDTAGFSVVHRTYNHLCGDEIEVGIEVENDVLRAVVFRGRGCSLCIASASMMTEVVSGASFQWVESACQEVHLWFEPNQRSSLLESNEGLAALRDIGVSPGRQRCVTLAWEALLAATKQQEAAN